MKKVNPADLLKHGLHLGHKKTKVHPKSRKYIHKFDNGTSVIDLFQTAELLDEAKQFMFELGKEGKVVLFVGTKKVAREALSEHCEEHNLLNMTNKWVGGFLTNFKEISQNIKRMNTMREEKANNAWNAFPKHEIIGLEKKLNRIASVYNGVKDMTGHPDALFILDIRKEKNALNEATQLNIPTIGVTDTNVNPDTVDYPIPANDDAVTSVTFIIDEIINAYVEGRKKMKKTSDEDTKKSGKTEKKAQKTEKAPKAKTAKKPAKNKVTKSTK